MTLTLEEAIRVSDLEEKIKKYSKSYYEGNPVISDFEFDELVDSLREIFPESPVLKSVGWGSGIDISGKKVDHKYQLIGSLDKVKDVNNIPDNYGLQYMISAKLDGLSAVCYYKNNKLVKAITRGDGHKGVDITDKLISIIGASIVGIPSANENIPFTGAIRGELVISNENWRIMRECNSSLKNQRNTAAGIINRNEITDDIDFIDFVVYNVVGLESKINYFYNGQKDVYNFLNTNFDKVCPNQYEGFMFGSTPKFNYDFLERLCNKYRKVYPCDGLVIGSNHIMLNSKTYAMEYEQIAFKFPAEKKQSRVKSITWNLTRTGKLIPVINIDTIQLSGTNVSNVTGFNAKFIKDKDICTDSVIEVMKGGEIIPDFQRTISSPKNDELPRVCPVCGHDLEWKGVDLICNNPDCSNKEYRDLQCWVNNLGKVDNIGDTLKFKFMNELGYNCIDDLYIKKLNIESWVRGTHKALFKKVMDKLLTEPVSVIDALCALNIPRLGRSSAEKLALNKDLIECLMNYAIDQVDTNVEELEFDISKVLGQATASSIMNNLNKVSNLRYIRDRLEYVVIGIDLSMIPVAITGKLSMKRAEFEKILNNYGYKVTGVSKDTRFLITDDPNSSSSKNKLADKLGITKITEKDFTEKYLK